MRVLPQPGWRDVTRGLVFAWLIFTGAVATITGLFFGIVGGVGIGVLAFACAALVGGIVSGIVTFTWGLATGLLISRRLAAVDVPRIHLFIFFGLGLGTGAAVCASYTAASGTYSTFAYSDASSLFIITGAISVLTGLSSAAGWVLATRRQTAGA